MAILMGLVGTLAVVSNAIGTYSKLSSAEDNFLMDDFAGFLLVCLQIDPIIYINAAILLHY